MNKKFFYFLLVIGLVILGTLIVDCGKKRKDAVNISNCHEHVWSR